MRLLAFDTATRLTAVALRDLEEVGRVVKHEMEHALELSVPIEATLKTVKNWYDVESYDPDATIDA